MSGHIGYRPDRGKDGRAAGPYIHGSHNSDTYNENVEAGLGLLHGENGDVFSANAKLGMWGDKKFWRAGGEANAQLAKGRFFDQESGFGADGGVGNASAEASIGSNGLTVGAGASVIDGAITLGGFNQEDSWADSQIRGGLGFGMGFGGRLHWGDSDGDETQELGFGFDYGPLSFDIKTEALGNAASALGDAWDWLTE